jgi:cytidyltransferase-like protein
VDTNDKIGGIFMKIVAISGGFDPIHVGHIRNIKEAKKLGDKLVVILMRDDQLFEKKGYCFMTYRERKEILESIEAVDIVVPNIDSGITCNASLERYRPNILAKGGDRTEDNMPEIEKEVCAKVGCKIVYGVGGGKIQSSSSLIKRTAGLQRTELESAITEL